MMMADDMMADDMLADDTRADDTREAVAIRLDRAQLLPDRNNALWGLRLRNIAGTLVLARTGDGPVVVFVGNGGCDSWEVPLEKVRYLGDPPPLFGITVLAGTAIRVDIDGTRRIINFTGAAPGNATARVGTAARAAWVHLLPDADLERSGVSASLPLGAPSPAHNELMRRP